MNAGANANAYADVEMPMLRFPNGCFNPIYKKIKYKYLSWKWMHLANEINSFTNCNCHSHVYYAQYIHRYYLCYAA